VDEKVHPYAREAFDPAKPAKDPNAALIKSSKTSQSTREQSSRTMAQSTLAHRRRWQARLCGDGQCHLRAPAECEEHKIHRDEDGKLFVPRTQERPKQSLA
jgi:hypothetical protein